MTQTRTDMHDVVSQAMSARTIQAVEGARAPRTVEQYELAWRQFREWCQRHRLHSLPATQTTVMEYLAARGEAGLKRPTLQSDHAAMRYYHRAAGERLWDTAGPNAVIKYYAKQRAKEGYRTRKAAPMETTALSQVIAAMDLSRPAALRDRCLLTLGVFGFARRGELAALDIASLRFVEDGLDIYLPYSKTDQDAHGDNVAIPYGQRSATCPVRAARDWLNCMAENGLTEGALFVPVMSTGHMGHSYRRPGVAPRLHGPSLTRIVKQRALNAGLENHREFMAHSLRRGGATAAARAGASVKAIRRQGRWAPNSTQPEQYVDDLGRWVDNPMIGTGL